ncbi:phage tail-collar fiber domain-containing protein [Arsenophonus apicola]|uniref:phage tail-collar fiber domain-containing protein n=1 Tax=Arsenophonus apicola TaxID=2879119 RepID=UPI001CDBD4B8|nr:phage tail protein [Arsenophonus apicola]UBX29856.1 phage tail protein [Arsenophonus apicola]
MASVITLAFEGWKAQEGASGKPVLLDEFVFANVSNLDPSKPIDRNEKLPPENQIVHRQAVNKAGLVSENAVAYSVTLGAEVGDFDFNWIGLLNKESGTVAMITHAPIQKKLKTQNGQQGNVLIRSFLLEFNGAAEETQIKTSAETWQIDFTARLSGIDEMQRLINHDHYGEAAFFDDGFEVTRKDEQYTVSKGLAYISGLRGQLEKNQIHNGLRNTNIYADFSYQGNIVSQWNTVVKTTIATSLANYVDEAGFTHFVFAIASIDANGNVKDLRPKGSLSHQSMIAFETQFKLNLTKKVDKTNISGVKGNNNDKVPSLNLFTTEVDKLQQKGDYATNGTVISKFEIANNNANSRVPDMRKVNGKQLNADISLSASDVGAYTKTETDSRVAEAKKTGTNAQTTANAANTAATNANNNANGRVPSGRKVNNKPLSTDISLSAADVGAYSKTEMDDKLKIISGKNTANKSISGWWKCGDTGVIIQWARYGKGKGAGTYNFPLPMKFPNTGLFCIGYVATAIAYDNDRQSQSAHLVNAATVRVTVDNGLETLVLAIGF